MRIQLAIVAGAALAAVWGPQTGPAAASRLSAHATAKNVSDQSRQQRQPRTKRQTSGQGQRQIACTQFGCAPIPPGCEIRTGFIPFTWDPSGFDEVVCPYPRRRPVR